MGEPFRDYYQLLGVEAFAGAEELKRAWHRLAKQLHPDRNPEDPLAEQRFKQVQAAYRTLTEPELRVRYDEIYSRRSRRARPTTPPPKRGQTDNPAGPRPGMGSPPPPPPEERARPRETLRPQPGADLRMVVQLPLERFTGGGRLSIQPLGQSPFELTLPLNLLVGDELVVPGRGAPGRHGGASGRLIVEIRPQLPEGCRLEGTDLVLELELDALLLMTGGTALLKHPAGRSLELRLPAGAQVGQRLRLRGQGLQDRQGRGDLVVEVKVRIRPATGFRTRRLAEKLRRLLNDGAED
ncbi:MAG: DnaJ domain-containing protein [Candidatus Delongbacteria bacterium]